MSIERKHIYILTLFALFTFFYRLGASDFWGALVARNAQMAKEMIQQGEWIVPYVNYAPDDEKPILWIWVLALFSLPLGVNEFSIRLPCALSALGTVYTVYALGRRIKSPRCGFHAALIFMSSVKVMHMARIPRIDMSLTLFVTLALFFFFRGYTNVNVRRGAYLWTFFFMALGFLDKGPLGVGLPAGCMLIYLFFRRDMRHIKRLATFKNIGLFLLVAAPWYIAVSIKTAGEFPRGFFLYHNATVFAFYSEAQPLWYYFPQFFCGFLPWSVFLPFALIAAFPRERREETLFPLVWFLWIFVFFTFVMYKRSDYILPLYPAAALLTAVFWESVEGDGARWRRHAVRFMVWLLIGIIGLACVVVTVIAGTGAVERIVASPWLERYSNATDRAMMLLYAGVLRRDAIWLVGVSAGVALFIYSQLRRFSREGSGVRAIIVGITVAMIFLNGYYLYAIVPEIDKKISLRPYAIFLSDRVEPGEPLALYDFWFYEFAYYMDRRVTELSYPHELRDYFADEGPRYCLVRKKHLDEARAHLEGAPYRIEPSLGDSEERFVMFVKYEGMEGG